MKKAKAGGYLRLSKEDKRNGESLSIETQKIIISEFAKENGFEIYKFYSDDGYSGTNFERPAFKEMISHIYDGKISCVIVKDLSRFGRNYIESGMYIERIFPYLGVRFIAIGDNYDSDKNGRASEEMLLVFKNLINDIYSADISIKTKSSLRAKMKKGDFIGAFAVYGYEKEGKTLKIDEEAAGVVREIFLLKMKGYNNGKIAEMLNFKNVLPPADYKLKKGLKYRCGFKMNERGKWSSGAVRRILENEIYTGKILQGKTQAASFRSGKRIKGEAIVGERKHKEIIPASIFNDVKRIMERDTKTTEGMEKVYIFSGILYCGGCGASEIRRKNGKYIYYMCGENKRDKNKCSSYRISEKRLIGAVNDTFEGMPLTRENVVHFIDRIYIYEGGKCEIKSVY